MPGNRARPAAPGSIGSVIGTVVANGASGFFAGIKSSKFIAGGGPGSYGLITYVLGSAKVNGPGSVLDYGIEDSTFVAGSGSGKIGNIIGYALAQGSQVESNLVNAVGIRYGSFYAGTGVGGSGNGTIGTITGTAIAEAAFGSAEAIGIDHTIVSAGGAGIGTIGAITGTGTATSHSAAPAAYGDAYGIRYSNIQAGVLSGGKGYISTVTGTATSTSQAYALAMGIRSSGVWAGYLYGKIGNVTATATATGETGAVARGFFFAGDYHAASYASSIPGGYTLLAGSGHDGGTGVIGTVTAKATATSNGGEAEAYGIEFAVINAGYTKGTISNITATATATAGAGTAAARGLTFSDIDAGIGYDGTGSIANIGGYAYATSTSGFAFAFGIEVANIKSGLNSGVIGTVTGKGTAIVLGTNQPNNFATAGGIASSQIYAGFSGIYGKIGAVTGIAVAKIHSSYENAADTAEAYASGLSSVEIYAQAPHTGTAVDGGTGIIGAITGTGAAYAYGYQVTATGLGINDSHAVASNGDLGTGTIAGIYGHGIADAVSNDLNATAKAYGIGSPLEGNSFSAGAGPDSVGHITGVIYGKADATASSVGAAAATALGDGIASTHFYAGIGSYGSKGYIGNVVGAAKVTATGGSATATGYGINGSAIKSGRILGDLGNVTGTATVTATSYYGNAGAYAHGIHNVYIGAGLGNKGVGTIGNVVGTGDAYATAKGAIGNATTKAYGIDPSTISAGSYYTPTGNAIAGTGTVNAITGTGKATSIAYGINTTAASTAFGIDGLTVDLGTANAKTGAALAGSGTVTLGITGNATAYSKAVNSGGNGSAKATGIADLYVFTADATG